MDDPGAAATYVVLTCCHVVVTVAEAAAGRGWGARAVAASPLPCPAGNVEFFLWLRRGPAVIGPDEIGRVVHGAAAAGVPDERLDP